MAVFVAKPAAGSEPGRREKGDWEDPIQVKYTPALYFNAIAAVEGVGHTQTASRAAIFSHSLAVAVSMFNLELPNWKGWYERLHREVKRSGECRSWVDTPAVKQKHTQKK